MDQLVSYVAPVVMLVLGLSYLLATEHWVKLAREILETPHRFLVGALGLLAAGLVVVVAHNWWHPSLGVVVTVFGWILVLKGAAFLLFPQISRGVTGWSDGLLKTSVRVGGLVLTVLGAILTYVTWFPR
jgi:uncharacterized protein YjeT (DUF2065 family)